jgi:hypothetical protein
VALAEQAHGGRDEQQAHERGLEGKRDGDPKPISWKATSRPLAKSAKTTKTIVAAPVIRRAVEATPWTMAPARGTSGRAGPLR